MEIEGDKKILLGEVVDRTNVMHLDGALQSLYEKGLFTIEIDCNKLEMIDSAGLGSLVLYQKKMKEQGGSLKLIHVTNEYINHLFNAIELSRVITIEH